MAKTRKTTPKPFCFILMPFAKEFDDVYTLGINFTVSAALIARNSLGYNLLSVNGSR
jgi:hypothetical protein